MEAIVCEEWRPMPVEGYEVLYSVSSHGRVLSARTGRFMLIRVGNHGYNTVTLSRQGEIRNVRVCRMVALAFLVATESRDQVNHISGIKTDDKLSNLEWSTRSENMRHAARLGLLRCQKGIERPSSKLNDAKIVYIMQQLHGGKTRKQLAAELGVSHQLISRVTTGKLWKHVKHGLPFLRYSTLASLPAAELQP